MMILATWTYAYYTNYGNYIGVKDYPLKLDLLRISSILNITGNKYFSLKEIGEEE